MATAIALIAIVIALCSGCSSSSSNLTSEVTMSTKWGTTIHYKVDDNWIVDTADSSSEYSAFAYYYTSDEEDPDRDSVVIIADNANYEIDGEKVSTTYDSFFESSEATYSQTPEEMAAEYKERAELYSELDIDWDYNPDMEEADYYPTYSDYSLSELDSVEIGGNTFRVFEQKVTVSYTESRYAELLKEDPNAKRTENSETYCALLLEGDHQLIVMSSNKNLLIDFVKTISVDWAEGEATSNTTSTTDEKAIEEKEYDLTEYESVITSWGTVITFKIDSSWECDEPNEVADFVVNAGYVFEGDEAKLNNRVDIAIRNTDSTWYESYSARTIDDFVDIEEGFHGEDAVEELDSIMVDGNEFKVFQISYENQDGPQEMDYALLKDGDHDIEIYTNNEELLRDFMATLEIIW